MTQAKQFHAQRADIIIEGATILTLDPQKPIIAPGSVAITGSKIVAVEEGEELGAKYEDVRRLDGRSKLVMPGLIDTHLHERPMRGVGDGLDVLKWHDNYVDKVAARMTPDDARLGALLTYAELVRSGTTSVLVMCVHPEAEADAAVEFGIRARLVPHAETDEDLETYAPVLKRVNGRLKGDRVKLWFGFELPAYHSDKALQRIVELAHDEDTGIHTHFSEFRQDDIEQLRATGLLGPRVSLAHCVWVDDNDIRVLASSATNVVHDPKSNMRFGNGFAPITEMLKAGVNVSLGTDGPMSTHRLDMFEEMRAAAFLHRGRQRDASALTASQVLQMATTNSARTLSLQNEIGQVGPGMKADLILLNTSHPAMVPLIHDKRFSNVATLSTFCASADVVETVIIDGKIVLNEGTLTTIDEESLLQAVQRRAPVLLDL